MNKFFDDPLDEVALTLPVGEINVTEVAIKDLPLWMVITKQVIDVDLPKKEFLSEEEFEEYLERLARGKFENAADRKKFVKKHLNNALYLDDEIMGEHAWRLNDTVDLNNARLCGFGILKTEAARYYLFQTNLCIHLPSQFAAYQALTFGFVEKKYLSLFASKEARQHFKQMIGAEVYSLVLEALGIVET